MAGRTAQVTIDPDTGCWLFVGVKNKKGYGIIKVAGEKWLAHRLSYTKYHGTIPPGMLVCHTCDNPPCCNPDHLFLGTHADNMKDMSLKGRGGKTKGENHVQSLRLDPERVQSLLDSGITNMDVLASEMGCSYGYVIRFVRGLTWQAAQINHPVVDALKKKAGIATYDDEDINDDI